MGNNLSLYRGDSALIECSVKNGTGGAFNLTDATATFSVRDGWDGNLMLTRNTSTGSGVSITNGTGGILQVSIGSGQLGTAGKFWYDIEVKQAGNVYTVIRDRIEVAPRHHYLTFTISGSNIWKYG